MQKNIMIYMSPLGALFSLLLTFVVILIITKIVKSETKASSIFSAACSFKMITLIVTLIVSLIQFIAGIDLLDYDISSLNIFDKGNQGLASVNLINLVNTYVVFIILYATSRLSGKASIILAIVYAILAMGFSLVGGLMQLFA